MEHMKKPVVIGAAVLAVLICIGVYAYASSKKSAITTNEPSSVQMQEAWIEVGKSPVLLVKGSEKTQVTSGETVGPGTTIETGSSGAAVIHFPDGSVARMDSSTTITLSAISFNPDNDSLIVSLGVTVGRIWSKVIGLATPESSWEVKTSNAVATVRGTAFGVIYKPGTSWILDSEHTVAAAPISPKNKQTISVAEVTLKENTMIEITATDAANAATAVSSSTMASKITPFTAQFKADAWVRSQQSADAAFNARIDALKAQGLTGAQLRDALREADVNLKNTLLQNPTIQTTITPPATPEAGAQTQTSGSAQTSASSGSISLTASNTVISTSRTVGDLVEQDTVKFTATSGGKDVTSLVIWSVVGPIGAITRTGLFTALLAPEIAEYGEGSGTVTATLPNGEVVKSASIHVNAAVSDFIREG
jgi:hypothetical protein